MALWRGRNCGVGLDIHENKKTQGDPSDCSSHIGCKQGQKKGRNLGSGPDTCYYASDSLSNRCFVFFVFFRERVSLLLRLIRDIFIHPALARPHVAANL